MAKIDDRRDKAERDATRLFVVGTDRFMSGWGSAFGGRSIYAVPCRNEEEAQVVLANMTDRSEMLRPRVVVGRNYRPKMGPLDHLSIPSPSECERWYQPGAFRQ